MSVRVSAGPHPMPLSVRKLSDDAYIPPRTSIRETVEALAAHRKRTVRVSIHDDYDVYIGRPSKFGNCFSHDKDSVAQFIVATREEAVAEYKRMIQGSAVLTEMIEELRGRRIACWCSLSSRCHGDAIIELLHDTSLDVFT